MGTVREPQHATYESAYVLRWLACLPAAGLPASLPCCLPACRLACCWLPLCCLAACWLPLGLAACLLAGCLALGCWLLQKQQKEREAKSLFVCSCLVCLAWPAWPCLASCLLRFFLLAACLAFHLAGCLPLASCRLAFHQTRLDFAEIRPRPWPHFVVIFNDLSICLQQAGLGRWPLPACCLSQN